MGYLKALIAFYCYLTATQDFKGMLVYINIFTLISSPAQELGYVLFYTLFYILFYTLIVQSVR